MNELASGVAIKYFVLREDACIGDKIYDSLYKFCKLK